MRVVVGAVLTLPPFSAGMAWLWMQHVCGLRALGHDVWLVEEVEPSWWRDADGQACPPEASVNRRRFHEIVERFGLRERALQVERGTGAVFGCSREELERMAEQADLLVNMSGHVESEVILSSVARRAYVDLDPVYTQLWLHEYGAGPHVLAHDVFLTVGLDIGTARTHIPGVGIDWHPTLPPVVLDLWPTTEAPEDGAWTTVASWTSYSDVVYQGEAYRSKHVEFARFADLPRRAGHRMEVSLKAWRDGDSEVASLRDGGWSVADAASLRELDAYQAYVAGSRGEIGVAKHAYVHGRSGWFSDRTTHYLASGRPVVAQATGFEKHLPTGEGLLAFSDLEEAVDAVRVVEADHVRHARAARGLAEDLFDHRKVLPALLETCLADGSGPRGRP